MESSTFTLAAADGTAVFVHRWLPAAAPRAVVQIAHGLAEHGGRYARLAAALTAEGYAVYANDHRGHGRTAPDRDSLGFFAAAQGWRKCLDDLAAVNRRIAAEQPGAAVILFGHSLGSFMVQHFMAEQGGLLAGVVLSGTGGRPSPLARVGRLVARIERLRLGAKGRSPLLHAFAFGAFNKPFAPARTPFDWLSRDPAEVDKYIADPLCGFPASTQLWIDVLDALSEATSARTQARIPKDLPVYVMTGGDDPVGGKGREVEKLLSAYRAAGLRNVTARVYPGGRHELLNETNRNEVVRDLLAWLAAVPGVKGGRTEV